MEWKSISHFNEVRKIIRIVFVWWNVCFVACTTDCMDDVQLF